MPKKFGQSFQNSQDTRESTPTPRASTHNCDQSCFSCFLTFLELVRATFIATTLGPIAFTLRVFHTISFPFKLIWTFVYFCVQSVFEHDRRSVFILKLNGKHYVATSNTNAGQSCPILMVCADFCLADFYDVFILISVWYVYKSVFGSECGYIF